MSACLVGEQVRYDGRHKRHAMVVGPLARIAELVPVCPEAEAGLGIPREPVHLVRAAGRPRLVGNESGRDYTPALERWLAARLADLARAELDGFLLKSASPSCALAPVPLYDARGRRRGAAKGLFAQALRERLPLLPVEEERSLERPGGLEHFLVRAAAYRRLRALAADRWRAGKLAEFHRRERLLVFCHDPEAAGRLERIAGAAQKRSALRSYEHEFMQALAKRPAKARRLRALGLAAAQVSPHLSAQEQRLVRSLLGDVRRGKAPWTGAAAVIRALAELHGDADLAEQTLFIPASWPLC